MKLAIPLLLTALVAGCVTAKPYSNRPLPSLPSAKEVVDYIEAHWTEDYRERFGRFASRPQDAAQLISVTDVRCRYHYLTVICDFNATGKFTDESSRTLSMSDEFDRAGDGALESVVVFYEPRRR